MGYTHYWSHAQDLDREAMVRAMIDALALTDAVQQRGVVLRGPEGYGESQIGDLGIALNGDAEWGQGHGSFVFPTPPPLTQYGARREILSWGFCKTARKPYDLAVCAILLVLKHHLGKQIQISSDGNRIEDEWLPAECLVKEVLDYDIHLEKEYTVLRGEARFIQDER